MNKDYIRRNELLGFLDLEDNSDCKRFENLSIKTTKTLVAEKFLHPEENQNGSPTTLEFIEFMEKYPEVKSHGFVLSTERTGCEYGIVLEGLQYNGEVSIELLLDFIYLCRYADVFEVDKFGLYSWWD